MDPDDPRPPYQQIAADLEDKIRAGEYPAGSKLPSRADLRTRYGVAGATVSSALRALSDKGLTVGRQGQGVFVRMRFGASVLGELVDLADEIDDGRYRRMSQVSGRLREIIEEHS